MIEYHQIKQMEDVFFMKLSDIRKITQNIPASLPYSDQRRFQERLRNLGLDPLKLYQELEMDSPYVDTHQDITYPGTAIQLHSHTFYELLYCRHAAGVEYLVGTERYKLQPGDVVFIPPWVSHCPILPERMTAPYVRDVLWISEAFLQEILYKFPGCSDLDFTHPIMFRTAGTRWAFLDELFHNGVLEAEKQEIGWETAVIANTLSILNHLRRVHNTIPMPVEKPELLDQLLNYIEDHLSQRITLSDTARHFFISESLITQTFRKKMGVSFYRCVTQRRLILSKALIERGLPLEAVAEQVGFSDYSSFFRAFKQEYGISPRQYRKLQLPGDPK